MTKLQTLPAASGSSAGKNGKEGKSPRRRESRGSLAYSRSARIKGLVKHAILIIVGAVMIYPLLWMVVSSLRPNDLIFREPGLWLESLEMSNYTDGWSALTHPFGHYMVNSAIVVLGSILGNLISCSMAAYAFARLQFTGKKIFFGIMLLTIMLPFHVVIVPQYILFSQIGWVNTFWPLIVPKLLATDAFFVFLMVQFIRGIPKDLDEAARIDGAGHPRIFLRVILPLMVPALATTTIFTFIWTWNDFFGALIYLTDPDMFTVPVALRAFVDSQSATSWGSLFAMSIVSLLPVFLVFLFGQRFLIKGIATTGIK
ncbi:carbohydrate ABC transporter permease [Paenarthrobacter aurescens]|uniref:Sugar ABC transporter permease n=1 Tax=Paenarthrobacter aurescens TaxID=43663 RepID=A0A4Y3N8W6_PAEAU|nr:carbohydrate ABC transporter permease [Paenarthrobacter aurescens]UKA49079.1 carbohydrate ABC transporter permease [Arthrobacter sp. FW305-123]MDO6144688.1 carbohydrate ABC transporter permease [Paenarthrobacter aurescens]MDO6148533.1 carbohydrate ABC transporter permease [Paenarthrobacter aurescens]MDO6159779.1 carbohydrate ABC transporter permease [Paenarthrobacter aurescens]MDO6163643.1 carbohydrate ABC transporter permease [Paenarthrobacter aurescens]